MALAHKKAVRRWEVMWATYFQIILMILGLGIAVSLINYVFKSLEYNAYEGSTLNIFKQGQESGYRDAKDQLEWLFKHQLDLLSKEKLPEMAGKFLSETKLIATRDTSRDFETGEVVGSTLTYKLPIIGYRFELRPDKEFVNKLEHKALAFRARTMSTKELLGDGK